MEINVVGRHMDVPDRFRRHLADKLDKVTQFAPAALRVDVEISQEKNPRQAELSDRVELTVHENGAVIRSEARARKCASPVERASSTTRMSGVTAVEIANRSRAAMPEE